MDMPKSVYFYCVPQGEPDKACYQHQAVQLAEGLSELGVAMYSNIPYWRMIPGESHYLMRPDAAVSHRDCDVVVFTSSWYSMMREFPADIFSKQRSYVTVYLDYDDGFATSGWRPLFREFDVVLKTHYNKRVIRHPDNMVPWAIGLTQRILSATSGGWAWRDRDNKILCNFRCSHESRDLAKTRLYPLLSRWFVIDETVEPVKAPEGEVDLLNWQQTGRRHDPRYYGSLLVSQAVSCFGGNYASRFLAWSRLTQFIKRWYPGNILFQWDSWRLWEAFSAGCLVFHVDFEKTGVSLPVMPQNWEHYIGVDFNRLDRFERELTRNASRFEAIAANGQQWARQYYCPQAVGRRFLDLIKRKKHHD